MGPYARLGVGFVLVAMLIGFYTYSVFSQTSSANEGMGVDNAELQKAQAVLAKHEAMLMNVPGVVGVGVGLTEAGNHAAIHVYVNVQATGGTLPPALPTRLDSVPIRVFETDEIRAR
jgi:hypothetical protein